MQSHRLTVLPREKVRSRVTRVVVAPMKVRLQLFRAVARAPRFTEEEIHQDGETIVFDERTCVLQRAS